MCVRARLADPEWTLCAVCRRPLRDAERDVRTDHGDEPPTHAACLDARAAVALAETPEPMTA
jgi:hypothetical protein